MCVYEGQAESRKRGLKEIYVNPDKQEIIEEFSLCYFYVLFHFKKLYAKKWWNLVPVIFVVLFIIFIAKIVAFFKKSEKTLASLS